jgi:hypothetical protein
VTCAEGTSTAAAALVVVFVVGGFAEHGVSLSLKFASLFFRDALTIYRYLSRCQGKNKARPKPG